MPLHESRRRFLTAFSGLGLGGTLLPGVLWAQVQQTAAQRITPEMLRGALDIAGLTFTDEDQKAMLQAVNQSLTRYELIGRGHEPDIDMAGGVAAEALEL